MNPSIGPLMLRALILSLGLWASAPASVQAALELVMVEEAGCVWCARWNADIGPIYPKTEEGEAAPLRRIDLREDLPEDLELARPAVFTPTFVLVQDGVELSRIEGYPGEDFFWGLLGRMLEQAEGGTYSEGDAEVTQP